MSLDKEKIKHVAKLARISVDEAKVDSLTKDLNSIFKFIEQLNELNTDKVEPLTSILNQSLRSRKDEISDGKIREKILKKLSPTEIANEIEELDTDDAADMIAELSSERKEKVMSKITDSNHLKDIKELLTYSEDTAGAIMAKELVKVKESLSVLKCIDYMRAQAENVTRVHSIYVVDGVS